MSHGIDSYLENQILTATPQKLQHMLVCGAIRFARQARAAWKEGHDDAAGEALVRCRRIITEILANIRSDTGGPADRTSSLYTYLFQTLTMISLNRAAAELDDVIKVLEIEEDTWRELCEKLPEAPPRPDGGPVEVTAGGRVPPVTEPAAGAFDSAATHQYFAGQARKPLGKPVPPVIPPTDFRAPYSYDSANTNGPATLPNSGSSWDA